jgi:CSLREA domain-containing protein
VTRRLTVPFIALLAAGVPGPAIAASAAVGPLAVTFTVNSFQDRPDANLADNVCRTAAKNCSLRAAVQQANATAGADQIKLSGGTYTLGRVDGVTQPATDGDGSRDLDISDSVTVTGATGSTRSVIDGGRFSRIFEIGDGTLAPTVNLSNLTVSNGGESETPGFGTGGGLLIRSGSVSLNRVVVRDNVTTLQGSGIANAGSLSLFESTVDGNRNLSTLGGGGVTATGGGIFNFSTGRVSIDRSTISGNFSLRGGGINNNFGDVTVTNSTISGNSAQNSGGGIRNQGDGSGARGIFNVSYSTVTGNQANMPGGRDAQLVGGGVANIGGQLNMAGTVLAGNTDNRDRFNSTRTPDCFSPDEFRFTSFRSNVIGLINGPCRIGDTVWGEQLPFDRFSRDNNAPLDARLGGLGSNGGRTATHPPLPGSPAIDSASFGSSASLFNCPATDQRGTSRPRDGDVNGQAVCDAGAFEVG